MIDYLAAIGSESERLRLVTGSALDRPVPTCPGWTLADLTWHIAEVQYFWSAIVADLLDDPASVVELVRPPAAELPELLRRQTAQLLADLGRRRPDDACWSWHATGHTVGWVRRRQAHEALIHRIDAELAVGELSPIDDELAADGVDEILTTMLDVGEAPDWAEFWPDARSVRLQAGDRTWDLELGRLIGTPPGRQAVDLSALALRSEQLEPAPTTTITGPAPDVDRWLWGRGPIECLVIDGDPAGAGRLRAVAAEATR